MAKHPKTSKQLGLQKSGLEKLGLQKRGLGKLGWPKLGLQKLDLKGLSAFKSLRKLGWSKTGLTKAKAGAIQASPARLGLDHPERPGQEKPPIANPKKLDHLFKGQASPEPIGRLLGSKILFDLCLVRPWILLGGFWLLLLLTIAIASNGLTNPGKQVVPLSSDESPALTEGMATAPDAAAFSRLTDTAMGVSAGDPAATLPGTTDQPLPVWPLLAMVVACAGGCLMMSRTGIAAPTLSRDRPRDRHPRPNNWLGLGPLATKSLSVTNGKATNGKASRSTRKRPSAVKKQLRPHYPSAQVMAVAAGKGGIQQVPQSAAPLPATAAALQASQPVSFRMQPAGGSISASAPVSPTVVPDTESHALDWPGGSLAHQLDVRQKRSLNSLL